MVSFLLSIFYFFNHDHHHVTFYMTPGEELYLQDYKQEDVEYIFRQLVHEEELHLEQYGAMAEPPPSTSTASTACDSPGDDLESGLMLRKSVKTETPLPNLGEQKIMIRRGLPTEQASKDAKKGSLSFGFELSQNVLGDNLISKIVPGSC